MFYFCDDLDESVCDMEKEYIKFAIPSLKFNISDLSSQTADQWRGTHFHDAVEIIYVKSGRIWIDVENEKIDAYKDEIVLINSNVIHAIKNASDGEFTYMQIELAEYCAFPENAECTYIYDFTAQESRQSYFVFREESEFQALFLSVLRETYEQKPYYEMYVKSYLQLLVAFMLRNHVIAALDSERCEKIAKFLPIAKYIEQNYKHPISLEDLTRIMNYNKYELCHKFKAATGKTIVEYINYVRIKQAKDLLCENKKSLTEVANCCGFSSVQYFNRVFTKYNGVAPGKYKVIQKMRVTLNEDDKIKN